MILVVTPMMMLLCCVFVIMLSKNDGSKTTVGGGNGGRDTIYQGTQGQYWKQGVTRSVRTLWETPFVRFQIHSIQLEDNNNNGIIIDDWLWFDECDNVNVLVQSGDDEFLVLEQTKYAIESGTTYAVLGGMIEADRDGNDPLTAAQRELREELHMEATRWTFLGRFVAAANRGGGHTYVYMAQDAHPIGGGEDSPRPNDEPGIAEGELERQHLLRLSRAELLEALMNGKFQEIKWTATVALALLKDASPAKGL